MRLIIWLVFCVVVGIYGDTKPLGFGWTFFWALLLSPVMGIIIATLYKRNEY